MEALKIFFSKKLKLNFDFSELLIAFSIVSYRLLCICENNITTQQMLFYRTEDFDIKTFDFSLMQMCVCGT